MNTAGVVWILIQNQAATYDGLWNLIPTDGIGVADTFKRINLNRNHPQTVRYRYYILPHEAGLLQIEPIFNITKKTITVAGWIFKDGGRKGEGVLNSAVRF